MVHLCLRWVRRALNESKISYRCIRKSGGRRHVLHDGIRKVIILLLQLPVLEQKTDLELVVPEQGRVLALPCLDLRVHALIVNGLHLHDIGEQKFLQNLALFVDLASWNRVVPLTIF